MKVSRLQQGEGRVGRNASRIFRRTPWSQ